MRTDSVKKYVIPNIPYLFILWACLKLGTAYRLAPGADFAHKLMGLVDMISGMDVKEDDESYMNAVDYMFKGLEKRKPDCFAVKQYKKYKLASGDVCSK